MHILSKSMTLLSMDPGFDFTKYARKVCYIFHPYPKLHISLFRDRMKKKATSKMCLGKEIIHHLSDMRVPFEEH